jgi:hypothetical protein
MALAQDIERARLEIASNYGNLDEESSQYIVPSDKLKDAQAELDDLFNLEQEVQIYTIKADDLDNNISITTAQMEAIMFMID